jgi:hypothetical protein
MLSCYNATQTVEILHNLQAYFFSFFIICPGDGCLRDFLEISCFYTCFHSTTSSIFNYLFNLLKSTGHVIHQQFKFYNLRSATHTVFICFVFIWEQTVTCATYIIDWMGFITDTKSVYCAVRTGSLNKAVCASYLKG